MADHLSLPDRFLELCRISFCRRRDAILYPYCFLTDLVADCYAWTLEYNVNLHSLT